MAVVAVLVALAVACGNRPLLGTVEHAAVARKERSMHSIVKAPGLHVETTFESWTVEKSAWTESFRLSAMAGNIYRAEGNFADAIRLHNEESRRRSQLEICGIGKD